LKKEEGFVRRAWEWDLEVREEEVGKGLGNEFHWKERMKGWGEMRFVVDLQVIWTKMLRMGV
jgi:hypothetical protein